MSGFLVLILLVLSSSVPAIAVYLWFRIARYQFSAIKFLLILLAGATAFFPALILQNYFLRNFAVTGRWGLMSHMFIRIALTEELSRLLILFGYFRISGGIYAAKGIEEKSAGSAVGLVAGLGLAILESAAYGAADTGIILIRFFTAAPLHAACGARVGAAASLFRAHPDRALFRFITAAVIHGAYNFMIIIPGITSLGAVLIAILAFTSSVLTVHRDMRL